jgi:poly-gamma-glutamate system protein
VIKLIKRTSVKRGDLVAVSLTGSFPALNIAVLSALEVLDIEPVIITAAGSSMWGANYPQFTYLDMENLLCDRGLLSHRTKAASLGGEDDMGRGLSPEGREYLEASIRRNNITIILNENLDDAIEKRMAFFESHEGIRLLINVGEHTTSWMSIDPGYGFIPGGQVKQGKGIIAQFSRAGIGVINLDNISRLAAKYGLPDAPIPLPGIGEGRLYYTYKYSFTLAIISLIILVIVLVTVLRFDIEQYFKKEKK